MHKFAQEIRKGLKQSHKSSDKGSYVPKGVNMSLNHILLALGYESSLVEMLGKRYGR